MTVLLRNLLFYIVLLACVACSHAAPAQVKNQYHLNIYNGLPDNHVYNCITDKHGYLWMSTPKGVVRYNGYETRVFDLSDGLPSADVWRLYEDDKNRIWLGSITNSIGYIYNGAYKQAVIPGLNNTIYPSNLRQYGKTLMFSSIYRNEQDDNDLLLFIEHNDTFNIYRSDAPYFLLRSESTRNHNILCKLEDTLYRLTPTPAGLKWEKVCIDTVDLMYQQMILNNYLVQYGPKDVAMKVWNLDSCHSFHFTPSLLNEEILYAFSLGDTMTVYCKSEIYTYDAGLNLRYRIPVGKLIDDTGIDGNEIIFVSTNKRWGSFVTTKNNGIYINYPDEHSFIHSDLQLQGHEQVGNLADSIGCWWNGANNTLVTVKGDRIWSTYQFAPQVIIRKVIPYNDKYAIVFDGYHVCFLDLQTGQLDYKLNDPILYPVESDIDIVNNTILFSEPHGIYRYKIEAANGQPEKLVYNGHYSNQRYKKISYLPVYQVFAAHNSDHVCLVYQSGKSQKISNEVLTSIGIDNIETITSDHYGNIYIKQSNGLTAYTPEKGKLLPLLPNLVLNGSQINVQHDRVVVAGRFGVAVIPVQGKGIMKPPVIYSNIKGLNYDFVYNLKCFGNTALLHTDKGAYTIDITESNEDATQAGRQERYNFIAIYENEYHDMKKGDTLIISQSNRKIRLDVINEKGYGNVVYRYKINDQAGWQDLQGSEVYFPDLEPDKYHRVQLQAHDQAWRSMPVPVYIYVSPYWWQTTTGIRSLWTGGIILTILGAAVIILITRRVVTRKNERRNLQLELELKAIYSQINPHFIFNTLSTALFFIKTDKPKEAYAHIIKFSKLLRAYIRSSRNKYVSIADEVATLNNYVALQQVRFENKFDYQLYVDEQIATETIKIPSLLLQPLVENAINHGIFHKSEGKGLLSVSFEINNEQNELICTIEDNGVGRAASKQINRNSMLKRESFGSDLVKDLINIFNKYEQMQISITYIDKTAPETGTKIILTIKNPINE